MMNEGNSLNSHTIELADFNANCLEIIAGLDAAGLIITNEGQPVAKITPVTAGNNESFIGAMKGQIQINGDIFSTGIEWNAQP